MFNMLVQIYGSKMKFLDEYQKLMAERIINSPFTDRDVSVILLQIFFVYIYFLKSKIEIFIFSAYL